MGENALPWQAAEHTKIKHEVYAHYMSKWLPILLKGFGGGDITYAEGFAGPGIYAGGEPGSPVIAIKALINDPAWRTRVKNLRFLFVDKDPECTALLRERVAVAFEPVPLGDLSSRGIVVDIETGECDPTLLHLLDRHRAWGRPMLVVLDTWGASVPLDLVRKVAANPSSEVIITIQPQYFVRFADADHAYGDRVFGSTGWRDVAKQPPENKARWLLQHYRETIREVGFDFVLDFELVPLRGQPLYLVFGTGHPQGLKKMKEAMWEVDDVAGYGYRDPRDPDQQVLDIRMEPDTAALRRQIHDHLKAQPDRTATVHDLRQFALYRTVYKESHVLPVLQEMVHKRELLTDRQDGGVSFSSTVRLH